LGFALSRNWFASRLFVYDVPRNLSVTTSTSMEMAQDSGNSLPWTPFLQIYNWSSLLQMQNEQVRPSKTVQHVSKYTQPNILILQRLLGTQLLPSQHPRELIHTFSNATYCMYSPSPSTYTGTNPTSMMAIMARGNGNWRTSSLSTIPCFSPWLLRFPGLPHDAERIC
jgi:hypothetical protein